MDNLVFLHGFLGSSRNWGPIIHRLQEKSSSLRTHSFDLLGHGAKVEASFAESFDLGMMAQDLQADLEGLDSFHLVCHSFAVFPFLKSYEKISSKIKSIILVDTAPLITLEAFEDISNIFTKLQKKYPSRQELKEDVARHYASRPSLMLFLMTQFRRNNQDLQAWKYKLSNMQRVLNEAYKNQWWSLWQNISEPIYLMRGQESTYFSTKKLEELVANSKKLNIKYEEITGAGHWVHQDVPDLFVDKIIAYIDSLEL